MESKIELLEFVPGSVVKVRDNVTFRRRGFRLEKRVIDPIFQKSELLLLFCVGGNGTLLSRHRNPDRPCRQLLNTTAAFPNWFGYRYAFYSEATCSQLLILIFSSKSYVKVETVYFHEKLKILFPSVCLTFGLGVWICSARRSSS